MSDTVPATDMNNVWIYALVDPRTPDVYRYIGRSGQPRVRHLQHCQDYGVSAKCEWVESLRMDGLFPRMVMLESVPADTSVEVELLWIEKHKNTLTNVGGMVESPEMEEMTDSTLAFNLRRWFERAKNISGQARRKSEVWVVLREVVGAFGNWRNARRGDPKKGFRVMNERRDK